MFLFCSDSQLKIINPSIAKFIFRHLRFSVSILVVYNPYFHCSVNVLYWLI